MSEAYKSAGIIERVELAVRDIALDLDDLDGRRIGYQDGVSLINALYHLKEDVDDVIKRLDSVLGEQAVDL